MRLRNGITGLLFARAITVAIDFEAAGMEVKAGLCNGVTSRRCERACPENVLQIASFFCRLLGSSA